MNRFYIALFLLFAITMKAQLEKSVISMAYRYTGRNVLQAGLTFKTNISKEYSLVAGASVLYTSINKENKVLPEANMYYTNRKGQLLGISLNPYSIEPRIGISLFSIFYINTGYAFPIHKERYFKGITFGLQFNIAPFKKTAFYDQFRMM